MNIISNSCIGSWITTRILKTELQNPFAWCIIDPISMSNLIRHFKDIDFFNIQLVEQNLTKFKIIIDNIVTCQMVHYIFDPTASSKRIVGVDIYANNVWELMIDRYLTRLKRMIINNEPPIFVLGCSTESPNFALSNYTISEQKKCIEANIHNYKLIGCFKENAISNNYESIAQTQHFKSNSLLFSKFIYDHSTLSIM